MTAAAPGRHFARTRGHAALFVALLWIAMAFVIAIGSIMGDCDPGPGCHDDDGARIGRALLMMTPVALGFGALCWSVLAGLHAMLATRISFSGWLLAITAADLAWVSLDPAFWLFLRLAYR
ncbi:MAG: hypothetical protein ABW184_11560 [Sphingobium sp.]